MTIFAHRGASRNAPENSLAAFQTALDQGACAIELDVQMTRDQKLVVCHDLTLDRTTDRRGYIKDLSLEEVQEADCGSWFHDDFSGERIPLLQEVLRRVPPSVLVNVEVKNHPCHQGIIEEALLELVAREGRQESVLYSSFDHRVLQQIHRLDPSAKIGALFYANILEPWQYLEDQGIVPFSLHWAEEYVSQELIQGAHQRGLKVFAYTVNQGDRTRELASLGLDGIFSDLPREMAGSLDGGR
ncbi:glycerophosphoryl diester phosphodiesterase [Alkalispirochaeta americana]|uniref:Glycerophosphoryl diester phosphodiesterase n=1 Tax=Alkalispirochaeta americana TaxID=159291 RepID=A0A1N6S2N2_9SPIO|nr:glycerophosphodiester phosphodiesterase [Alkalispirochaeta americana]SIQ35398.1 glycerophosphoryl diester phosphodiesterase [Alkalispirochaeta americana]